MSWKYDKNEVSVFGNRDLNFGSEVLITTRTVLATENGMTFYLALAGGFTVTLPTPALGLRFKFVVKVAPTTAYIILSTPTDIIIGYPIGSLGADETANGNALGDQVNFVANVSLPGDSVVLESDGTYWYAIPLVKATGAVTITG